jgi:hypothetical protein
MIQRCRLAALKTLTVACVVCVGTLDGASADAQTPWISGYLQTVPLFNGATPQVESSLAGFNRFRLTIEPVVGPFSLEAAYEHALTLRRRDAGAGVSVGGVPSGGEWLELDWALAKEKHVLWRHRFDRLKIAWSPTQAVELSAGRQAVSWGTTLFLTPADPFLPFNPTDPFRQFRGGVDSVRARLYPGPLSQIDLVVRPSHTEVGEEVTALGRGLTTWGDWEVSAWGGSLYGDTTGAFGTAGGFGAWAVRGEGVVREIAGEVVFRGTIGVDRILQVGGKDLFLVAEYQRDNLAAADPVEYLALLRSAPFRRGELQVLGRDEVAVQMSYQLHPLWSLGSLWLWNLNDRSALLSPSFAYSASDDVSLTGGIFFGLGDDTLTPLQPIPSEFGLASNTGYLSLSWFF